MIRVSYRANYGFAGANIEDTLEYPDDTPDSVIEEDIRDLVLEQVDWSWWRIEEG